MFYYYKFLFNMVLSLILLEVYPNLDSGEQHRKERKEMTIK